MPARPWFSGVVAIETRNAPQEAERISSRRRWRWHPVVLMRTTDLLASSMALGQHDRANA